MITIRFFRIDDNCVRNSFNKQIVLVEPETGPLKQKCVCPMPVWDF